MSRRGKGGQERERVLDWGRILQLSLFGLSLSPETGGVEKEGGRLIDRRAAEIKGHFPCPSPYPSLSLSLLNPLAGRQDAV